MSGMAPMPQTFVEWNAERLRERVVAICESDVDAHWVVWIVVLSMAAVIQAIRLAVLP